MSRARTPLADRLWRKITKTDSCWLWTGPTTASGYGVIGSGGRGGKTLRTHRVSYELARGPIPEGHDLDHLCRVRACCNPDHLQPVDRGTNIGRGLLGFELTGRCRSQLHDMTDPGNVFVRANGDRQCRVCLYTRARERHERKVS